MLTIFDPVYSHSGYFRLSLGFPSPLYAGTALVLGYFALCAVAERLQDRQWMRKTCQYLAVLTCLLLGMTGSRTSAVALGIGILFWFGLSRWRSPKSKLRAAHLGVILIALAVGLFISGNWKRVSYNYVTTDPSAINRLSLWGSGVRALAATRPMGAGDNASAGLYRNWYARPGLRTNVASFSSSVLTVYLEDGQVAGCLICLLLLFPAMCVLVTKTSDGELLTLSAGCLALLISYSFITLGLSPALYFISALFVLCACCHAWRHLERAPQRALVVGATLVMVALAVNVVRWTVDTAPRGENLQYTFGPRGEVMVRASIAHSDSKQLIWIEDPQITGSELTGAYFGAMIRKMVPAIGASVRLRIVNEKWQGTDRDSTQPDLVVVLGRTHCPATLSDRRILIVNPTRAPDLNDDHLSVVAIVLPEVDAIGWNESWRKWAAAHQVPVRELTGTGSNLFYACESLATILKQFVY